MLRRKIYKESYAIFSRKWQKVTTLELRNSELKKIVFPRLKQHEEILPTQEVLEMLNLAQEERKNKKQKGTTYKNRSETYHKRNEGGDTNN